MDFRRHIKLMGSICITVKVVACFSVILFIVKIDGSISAFCFNENCIYIKKSMLYIFYKNTCYGQLMFQMLTVQIYTEVKTKAD